MCPIMCTYHIALLQLLSISYHQRRGSDDGLVQMRVLDKMCLTKRALPE